MTTQDRILELTGLTEEQYFFLKIDNGFDYLKNVIKADEESIKSITESRLFWSWWVNHWERRDMIFLQKIYVNPAQFHTYTDYIPMQGCEPVLEFEVFTCKDDLLEFYLIKNNPVGLDLQPNRTIIPQAYTQRAIKALVNTLKQPLKINL